MKRIFIFMLIILFLSSLSLLSETLDEILAKNYESKGGLEKLKSVKSIKIKGKIVQAMMNMEMPMQVWYKKPNKIRMESEFQGRKIIQGYDGKIAWWIMPFLGSDDPQEMGEEQAREVKDMADSMDPLVDYKEKGYKLEFMGKEDLEGTEVYKLKMTKKNNKEEFYYLDIDSGIELKTTAYVKRGENEILVETIFGDYQEVDGLMMAFQIEVRTNNQTSVTMTFEEFKFNEEMEDSLFVMPPKKKTETSGEK
ncbi:MAG: outer membrane lipoprotein-sorting protein [Candidatus Aminicenantes bacterium]|nr:outer membrane lipoprotein-sorting protein [Candidatus Aminicenantes bacterium]